VKNWKLLAYYLEDFRVPSGLGIPVLYVSVAEVELPISTTTISKAWMHWGVKGGSISALHN